MEEHDHSAHAATTAAAPGTIAHPVHGTWPGHVLPGSFFLIWSAWWMFSVFRLGTCCITGQLAALSWSRQLSCCGCRLQLKTSTKAGYLSRSWFEFPWLLRNVPLEPWLKLALPFVGANAEIWAGHTSYRCGRRMLPRAGPSRRCSKLLLLLLQESVRSRWAL